MIRCNIFDISITMIRCNGPKKEKVRHTKWCLNNDKMASLFPLNPRYNENARNSEKYKVNFAHSNRLKYSAIPALQRLLNENSK